MSKQQSKSIRQTLHRIASNSLTPEAMGARTQSTSFCGADKMAAMIDAYYGKQHKSKRSGPSAPRKFSWEKEQ